MISEDFLKSRYIWGDSRSVARFCLWKIIKQISQYFSLKLFFISLLRRLCFFFEIIHENWICESSILCKTNWWNPSLFDVNNCKLIFMINEFTNRKWDINVSKKRFLWLYMKPQNHVFGSKQFSHFFFPKAYAVSYYK